MRLEELVGLLSTENGKRKSVLALHSFCIRDGYHAIRREQPRKKVISTYLLKQDKNAIPRLVSLHEELCRESAGRLADDVAECLDLILPLYFSRPAVARAASA